MYFALNKSDLRPTFLLVWRALALVLLICVVAIGSTRPALAGASAPARPGITIIRSSDGNQPGAEVNAASDGRAVATGESDATDKQLGGPEQIEVLRSGSETSLRVDEDGNPVSWDGTDVPEGQYKLVVYSMRKDRMDRFRFIEFRVENLTKPAEDDTVQRPNINPGSKSSQEPATPTPVIEDQATDATVTQDTAAQAPATQVPATQQQVTQQPVVDERVVQEPAVQAPVVQELVVQQPAPQQPLALAPTPKLIEQEATVIQPSENPNQASPTSPEPTTQAQPSAAVQTVPAPTPVLVQNFEAKFGPLASTYQQGSGKAMPISVSGELKHNQDLMVLAWSVAERRMVKEFAFTKTDGPWEIPASKLDLLPPGGVNLQLHVREASSTIRRQTVDVEFLARTFPFKIAFSNPPAGYELGSGRSLTLQTKGTLDQQADVLVLAWSLSESRLVNEFAFTMERSPWTIPASQMDKLPVGDVELQLITRDANRDKVIHRMTITAPPPKVPVISVAPETVFTVGQAAALNIALADVIPNDCELVAMAWSVGNNQMVDAFEHTLSNSDPSISAGKMNLLPEGQNEVRLQVRQNGQVLKQVTAKVVVEPKTEPEPILSAEPAARFANAPAQYTQQSGGAIGFEVENLPAGGDVLVLAWSDVQGKLVDGFGHTLRGAPWQIEAAKLNTLPAGKVELQVIVRGGDTRPKTTHRLVIVAPTTSTGGGDSNTNDPTTNPTPATDENPTTENPDETGGETTEPPTNEGPTTEPENNGNTDTPKAPDLTGLSSVTAGFTALVKSADTRVIYVSDSLGKDSNDGQNENAPVKTLQHGMSLLRHGKPDWLLLKAGDTWENQSLSGFNKGGAGADKPMVIGAYGQGARPLIIPPVGSHGIKTENQYINGLVIQGLHIYGATRDPGSPKYVDRKAEADGINIRTNGSEGRYVKGLVIEDCKISHFDANIKIVDDWARKQGIGVPGRIDAKIRRNIIRYASGADSHSIGIYLEGTRDTVVEQNLIDHNGWAQTDGVEHRNKRSHNIYAQQFNGPITIRHNILSRGAAHGLQLRAGGDIEQNLFVRNALAFWTAVNDSKANYNVIMESDDMNPDVPEDRRGVGIEGWNMKNYEVIGNVVARRAGSLQRPGIDVSADNLTVKNNIVYKWSDNRVGEFGESINYGSANPTVSGNLAQELFNGQNPPYVDPERSVGSYAKTLGMEPKLETFLDAAASRPRGQWIDELDPASVCRYIRNGFELLPHD